MPRPVDVVVTVGVVSVEELDKLGVQRDVAVVVELADGDSEPVPTGHVNDRVKGKGAELTDA